MLLAIAVIGTALLLLLLGCSSESAASLPGTPPSQTTSTSARINPNAAECSNVEGAYNAWLWEPSSSPGWSSNRAAVRELVERGKTFINAVDGYRDKPALALAVAVSQYNLDVATLNAQLLTARGADEAVVKRIVDGVATIAGSFGSFKYETCQGS